MSLGYKVWSEEDIKNRNVVPDGEYPFEILSVTKKPSKQKFDKEGAPLPIYPMLEIQVEYWDNKGVVRKLTDWIVLTEGMDWKLRHLANSTDTLGLYESQALDCHHFPKKKGIFNLGNKIFKNKQGEDQKGNYVKDYVKKSISNTINGLSSMPDSMGHDMSFDADIPLNL